MAWTDITRQQHNRDSIRYPSDLSDGEWAVVESSFRHRAGVAGHA